MRYSQIVAVVVSVKAPRILSHISAFTAVCLFVTALVAPRQAAAIENYYGNVVGQCVTYENVIYNVNASISTQSPNWFVAMLQYVFNTTPNPSNPFTPSTSVDPDDKTRYFLVTPGTYKVTVQNPALQGEYQITVPSCAPPPKGLTWKLVSTNAPTGTIRVGCGNSAGQNECNPYQGDTACTAALPILCIKKAGTGFPLSRPASVNNISQYNKWSGGVVGTTSATVPPATLAGANALCVSEFGTGWRVAEFHDGWGWYFQAYGGVGDPTKRFWINANGPNGQPSATCWH